MFPDSRRKELAALVRSLNERVRLDLLSGKHRWCALGEGERSEATPRNNEITHQKEMPLETIRKKLGDCRGCPLWRSRRNLVFGEGNPEAELVFVGEAPGEEEDEQGRPFVGQAGQLLTKIIAAMGLKRDDVYICNILKCRPPGNRDPLPEEIKACEPFLIEQLQAIRPRVICALGNFASRTLLKSEAPITTLRGAFHSYHGTPLMPTYHPAYLLRNPKAKRQVWEDIQKIMALLGLKSQLA